MSGLKTDSGKWGQFFIVMITGIFLTCFIQFHFMSFKFYKFENLNRTYGS